MVAIGAVMGAARLAGRALKGLRGRGGGGRGVLGLGRKRKRRGRGLNAKMKQLLKAKIDSKIMKAKLAAFKGL
jgi:hypothetical protein